MELKPNDRIGSEAQWFGFLLNCLGEVINCCEDPELLREELELARLMWGHEVETELEDVECLERTVQAKRSSRGGAQVNLAVVVAWRLSKTGKKDPVKKQELLRNPRPQWIEPQELIGTYLTEIEACRLVRRKRCSCTTTCRGIKFAREWAKIERG